MKCIKSSLCLRNKNGFPIQTRRPDLILINKKRRTYHHPMDFAVSSRTWKVKENEKVKKFLNLARKVKRLRNMKLTVIPIVFGALGTIQKNMEKRLDELKIKVRIKTIQTTAPLNQTRILRRVLEQRVEELKTRGRIKTIQITLLKLTSIFGRVQEIWWDSLSLRFQRKTTSENWCEKLAKSQIVICFYVIFSFLFSLIISWLLLVFVISFSLSVILKE